MASLKKKLFNLFKRSFRQAASESVIGQRLCPSHHPKQTGSIPIMQSRTNGGVVLPFLDEMESKLNRTQQYNDDPANNNASLLKSFHHQAQNPVELEIDDVSRVANQLNILDIEIENNAGESNGEKRSGENLITSTLVYGHSAADKANKKNNAIKIPASALR